jgi:tetratricopeptide (TPR) repeat protein
MGGSPASDSTRELRRWSKQVRKLEKAGEFGAARAAADALVEDRPDSPKALIAAADVYAAVGDRDRAAAGYREAWEITPRHRRWKIAAPVARGLSAADRGEEALELLRSLDDVMAAGPLAVERAHLLRRLGCAEEACSLLSTTLEVEPYCNRAWNDLIELLEQRGRPHEAAAVRRRRRAVPRKLSTADVVDTITAAFPDETSRYVVNIGCRDGRIKDPCYELYRSGYPGLAIDAGDFPELHRNLPQPEVRKLLNTPLTPENMVDVLRRAGCPPRPVLLKIDIDGFDGPLLEAALTGFEPDVIRIEVSPDFPPPLQFAIQYDPRYVHSGTAGFFGCSLAFVLAVCRPLGYELLHVDFSKPTLGNDAVLVKARYLGLWDVERPVDERELFLREPYRGWRGLVEVGVDTRAWRERADIDELLVEARNACIAASLSRSGEVLPFLLRR